ncbi:MAG: dienelactone hydrolase family protein [Myxococcota bacterium]
MIVPSAFGVAPDLLAQMADLADTARLVVTFDPFFRDDPGPVPYDAMARVLGRLQRLDRARLTEDLHATLAAARAEAGGRVVVVGVCFGGPFALAAAADGLVDGVVTWHGTRLEDHLARAAGVRCPARLHFGGADPFVPMSAVERVRAAFAGHPDTRVVVHAGATHGFTHRDAPQAYDAVAERAAMDAVRELARGA